ncbi:MAG: BatA domain-containing protein, partial [Phycisphaerae bacterium]
MTWLFPGMLIAAGAVGLPVLIHLLMRPRPRKQVFPALRLLRTAHQQAARQSRLRHLLLLAARIAVILLLALALARPVLRGTTLNVGTRKPTAAVFCIDDSASMDYRYQGRTRLERALDAAAD